MLGLFECSPLVKRALLAVCCLSAAAPASMYDVNLLVNPSFEYINASGILMWSATGEAETWTYLDKTELPKPVDDPLEFRFLRGGQAMLSTLSQSVDLNAVFSDIDAGLVTCHLEAYLGGSGSQEDHAAVTVEFLDAADAVLDSAVIGPVTAADRGNATILLPRETDVAVPAGTRSAVVTIAMTRANGTVMNEGYADLVELTLVPEPGALTVLAVGSGLLLLRRRKRR